MAGKNSVRLCDTHALGYVNNTCHDSSLSDTQNLMTISQNEIRRRNVLTERRSSSTIHKEFHGVMTRSQKKNCFRRWTRQCLENSFYWQVFSIVTDSDLTKNTLYSELVHSAWEGPRSGVTTWPGDVMFVCQQGSRDRYSHVTVTIDRQSLCGMTLQTSHEGPTCNSIWTTFDDKARGASVAVSRTLML